MVSIYLAQALVSGRIEVKGGLERFRDFIFIDDVVEAWYRASTRREALNNAINIGTGIRTSISELLKHIHNLLPNSTSFISSSTMGDQSGIYSNTDAMRGLLGFEATIQLNRGLQIFLTAAKAQI
jgi:UDP-glucose 4-epimerase